MWTFGALSGAALLFGIERCGSRQEGGAPRPAPSESAPAALPGTGPSEARALETEAHAWQAANLNLAEQVRETQHRLDRNEEEKRELTKELASAKARVAALQGNGAPARNEFDLTTDDWKALAKTGTVKARYPCGSSKNEKVSADKAAAIGLDPRDAPAVEAAMKRAEERIWDSVARGCAAIVGSADLAERLGTNVCVTIVSEAAKNGSADIQLVADVRAGNRLLPPPGELDAYATVLLAETTAMRGLVADLAQTFGPEEAKRIAFSEELGSCSGSVGGAPPPSP